MAYNRQNFQDGNVLTAAQMNNIDAALFALNPAVLTVPQSLSPDQQIAAKQNLGISTTDFDLRTFVVLNGASATFYDVPDSFMIYYWEEGSQSCGMAVYRGRYLDYEYQPTYSLQHNLYLSGNTNTLQLQGNWSGGRCIGFVCSYNEFINSCFIEGTLVAMADGTEKPIEKVKAGEQIAYYSNKKKTSSVATVYVNEEGTCTDYTEYEFENGTSIKVFGRQRIYHVGKNQMVNVDEFALGDKTRLIDGTDVALVSKKEVKAWKPLKHYHLVTDTAAYHANGIMAGMLRSRIYNYILKHGVEVPAEKLRWHKAFHLHSVAKDFKNSIEYKQAIAADTEAVDILSKQMQDIQQELSALDYKNAKYIEGALSEDEFKLVCAHKAELRNEYGALEPKLAEHKQNIHEITESYKQKVAAYKVEDFLDI